MTWHDIVVMAKSCQILRHLPDVEGMCKKAYDTILHSQMLSSKDTNYRPFKEGEKVWLDAKNLHTTHPTHKLRAKRYGPFQIVKKLSDVTYQVNLPPSWKIHNIFHTSYVTAALHSVSALDYPLGWYASPWSICFLLLGV